MSTPSKLVGPLSSREEALYLHQREASGLSQPASSSAASAPPTRPPGNLSMHHQGYYQPASSSSALAPLSRPPGNFSEFSLPCGPTTDAEIHLEALLQRLMNSDTSTEVINESSTSSEPISLDDLLLKLPFQVGANSLWAAQVEKALRRPTQEIEPLPAGFVAQRLLETEVQREVQRLTNAKIMEWILRHKAVYALSELEHGCWILQKALEVVDASIGNEEPLRELCADAEPKTLLAAGFKTCVNAALQDKHANYVLQKCIEVLPRESTQFILDEIWRAPGGAVMAAKNKFGCRVMQRLIEHFWDEKKTYEGLLGIVEELIREDEICAAESRTRLVEDQYANFVVQSLIEHGAKADDVVDRVLMTGTHKLATSFYASHVLSFVLTSSSSEFKEHQRKIVVELAGDDDKWARLQEVKHSRMGSFVFKQVVELQHLLPKPVDSMSKGSATSKGRKGRSPRHR